MANQGCSITLIVQESHHSSCGWSKLSPLFAEKFSFAAEHATPTKNGIHDFGHARRKCMHRILHKGLGLQVTGWRIFN